MITSSTTPRTPIQHLEFRKLALRGLQLLSSWNTQLMELVSTSNITSEIIVCISECVETSSLQFRNLIEFDGTHERSVQALPTSVFWASHPEMLYICQIRNSCEKCNYRMKSVNNMLKRVLNYSYCIYLQYSWKLIHPTDKYANPQCPDQAEDYERVRT